MMQNLERLKRRAVGRLAQVSLDFARWLHCPVPLVSRRHILKPESERETLFVLLPGIQDTHLEFETAGFIRAAKELDVPADMVVVDAHIGYYAREMILERLREDIILPARTEGYRKIWLVGTSLGGLGSVLYAGKYESDLDGVLLLAPFLGEKRLIREIDKAGGPESWSPVQSDFKAAIWSWLKNYFIDPLRNPKLYLGFGSRDRFEFACRFLAKALPGERVLMTSGAHEWGTWHRLWQEFLVRYAQIEVA